MSESENKPIEILQRGEMRMWSGDLSTLLKGVREAALEEAALICEAQHKNWHAIAAELAAALDKLYDEATGFSVSGVYFNEPCMRHEGPKLAEAALAKWEAANGK